MGKPSLLILSLGELGTAMLEAAARSDLFGSIIVASRSLQKAQERAGNAVAGAGLDGFFPDIRAEALDFSAPDFARRISDMAPDYLFSAPSLLPWWKVGSGTADLPFAGYTALHLALMAELRNRLADAAVKPFWIGASYPDVINAVLNRSGYGPDCGIGNVQEPVPKIQRFVAARLGCAPEAVAVRLVAQHAFEYYVLNGKVHDDLPPHLLHVTVDGRDVSGLAAGALRDPFPFPYDLHFNRVTASAGMQALRALASPVPLRTHLPGIGCHLGGYPVTASTAGIRFDLAPGWTLEQAASVNAASLPWDGIAAVEADGLIHFTDQTSAALKSLLGQRCETLDADNAAAQAQALLNAL